MRSTDCEAGENALFCLDMKIQKRAASAKRVTHVT